MNSNPMQDQNGSIILKFSSFLEFPTDGFSRVWRRDRKLQLNMQHLVEYALEDSQEFWARYFLRVLRREMESSNCGEENAQKHLSAYLQKACEYVAVKLYYKHRRSPILLGQYGLRDYFQIASLSSNSPQKLLKNFHLNLPTSMTAYAQKRIEGEVKKVIRQENYHINRLKYSNWGLLRNVSRKELEKALQSTNQQIVEQYVLVWQCFKEIYVPTISQGSRSLDTPTKEVFKAIADCYNQRRYLLACPVSTIETNTVEQILETCAQALRNWRTIHFVYPDAPMPDSSITNRWDLFAQDLSEQALREPLVELAKTEQWQAINSVLEQAFTELPNYEQTLLRLDKQGLGLTGTQIGQIFALKQFQVSRQLKYSRRKLLKALAQWCHDYLNIQLGNEERKQLDDGLKSWLEKHCQAFLDNILEQVLLELTAEGKEILQQRYRLVLTEDVIAKKLGLTSAEVANQVTTVKQQIQEDFITELEAKLELNPNTLSHYPEVIATFIKNKLPKLHV